MASTAARLLRRALASPDPVAYLREQEAEERRRTSRKRQRAAPRRGAAKKKRAEKGEETARLHAEAEARADGRGELCGLPFGDNPNALPEMCHLDGGGGKKKTRQWIGNVLMEHHACHQSRIGLDKNPLRWFDAVEAWAKRHGYPLPERFRKLAALRQFDPMREDAR